MPPIVSFVGHSRSGKTTIIEKLVRELVSRGYCIATVKHTHHSVAPDQPEKDNWRHLQAGSAAAVLSSPDMLVLTRRTAKEADLDNISRMLGEDYDLILAEGYKRDDAPKIEVYRKNVGPRLTGLSNLAAIVSDEPIKSRIRRFAPDDIAGLAGFLEEDFIKMERERVALYVNGSPVPMKSFIKEMVANILKGAVASLKGIGEIKSLEVLVRRQRKG